MTARRRAATLIATTVAITVAFTSCTPSAHRYESETLHRATGSAATSCKLTVGPEGPWSPEITGKRLSGTCKAAGATWTASGAYTTEQRHGRQAAQITFTKGSRSYRCDFDDWNGPATPWRCLWITP